MNKPKEALFVPWRLVDILQGPKNRTIDPETRIWPISEWGYECGRGFVSEARFAGDSGTRVIKRTNRNTTRKWRAIDKEHF